MKKEEQKALWLKWGNWLKEVREALHLTQVELAKNLDLGINSISLRERGETEITDEFISKFQNRYLRINANYIKNGGIIMKIDIPKTIDSSKIVKERFIKLLKELNLSHDSLMKKIGYTGPSMFNHYFYEKGTYTRIELFNIVKVLYPKVNVNWLQSGSGKMFVKISKSAINITFPAEKELPASRS